MLTRLFQLMGRAGGEQPAQTPVHAAVPAPAAPKGEMPEPATPHARQPDMEALLDRLLGPSTPPARPAEGAAWRALPGHVIELGATGFQIHMDLSGRGPLYGLVDPEGRRVAGHFQLDPLKRLGEQLARDRDEFDFPGRQAWPRQGA